MAISRPNKYIPDKASASYSAINGRRVISSAEVDEIVSKDKSAFKTISATSVSSPTKYISTPFVFSVSGNSPIFSFYITIYNMEDGIIVYKSIEKFIDYTLYPVDYKGEDIRIKVYIPELDSNGKPYIDNKPWSNYKWAATISWLEESRTGDAPTQHYLTGAEVYFESRETLTVDKIILDDNIIFDFDESYLKITGITHKFRAEHTPKNVPISHFQWDLYDPNGILIHTTGVINSPDIRFEYTGFLPISYTLRLTVVNITGNKDVVDIPLYNEEMDSVIPLEAKLTIVNKPIESCLHVSWDHQEIGLELNDMGYIIDNIYDDIRGFELYRQKKGDLFIRHLFSFSNKAYEFYDYNVANDSEYIYYLYPVSAHTGDILPVYATTMKENEYGVTEKEYHKVSFDGWFLLVLSPNENQGEGVYRVSKLFNWYAETSAGNISNNANITINNSFGRYPRVQRSKNNYLKIPLQGMVGYIDCENNEFIDNQTIIDDIRELTTLDNIMILKNSKGAIMNVSPSSDISFTLNERVDKVLTSMSMEFVEVGSSNNISVINKVSNPEWMFTLTGYQPIGSPSVNLAGYRLDGNTILAASNVTVE